MFFSDLMDRGQAIPYVFKYSRYAYQTLKSYILRFFFYTKHCVVVKKGTVYSFQLTWHPSNLDMYKIKN